LSAAVAEVQNALAADAIVDREANANQGKVEFARQAVALAAADQEIGSEAARHSPMVAKSMPSLTMTLSAAAPATAFTAASRRPLSPPDAHSTGSLQSPPEMR
jgi:hypothetical protein